MEVDTDCSQLSVDPLKFARGPSPVQHSYNCPVDVCQSVLSLDTLMQ